MACLGGFVWFVKRTVNNAEDNIKHLQNDLQTVKEKYLHKDDFREFKSELRTMFEEIRKDIQQLRKHGE
jgi:hypothetical protein